MVMLTPRDLDRKIRTKVADHVVFTIHNMVEGGTASESDFKAAVDSGLRDDVLAIIREYYSFLGDVEIELSAADIKDICKSVGRM